MGAPFERYKQNVGHIYGHLILATTKSLHVIQIYIKIVIMTGLIRFLDDHLTDKLPHLITYSVGFSAAAL